MRTNRIVTAILGVALVSACSTPSGQGAAGGALVGAALGGMLGYGAGRYVEEEDARRTQAAIEANRRAAWNNDGNYFQVTPTDTIMRSGRECREFTMLHTSPDGRTQTADGLACRQPNGNWELQG
jgi:surface antigen